MNAEQLAGKVLEWTSMRFFPQEREGRTAIVNAVLAMSGKPERAVWIVDQMLALTSTWPGIAEVRAVYCCRFKPADGLESDFSELCPSGQIPAGVAVGFVPKSGSLVLPDPRSRELPPGEVGEILRGVIAKSRRF